MTDYYASPRWSQELLDCSMPMTFDTYNICAYNCLYSNAPDDRIWMADGLWRYFRDVRVGDEVMGWRESASGRNVLVPSVVEDVMTREAECVTVHLASGVALTVSSDHHWYTGRREPRYMYQPARVGGYPLYFVTDPWSAVPPSQDYMLGYVQGCMAGDGTVGRHLRVANHDVLCVQRYSDYVAALGAAGTLGDRGPSGQWSPCARHPRRYACEDEYQCGWLAGVFDTDGAGSGGVLRLCQSSRANALVSRRAMDYLAAQAFAFVEEPDALRLVGGRAAVLDFWRWCQPALWRKVAPLVIGREANLKQRPDAVVEVDPVGVQPVVSVKTSTINYIAEGYASRNCFSYNQRSIQPNAGKQRYLTRQLTHVNVEKVKRMFLQADGQFGGYIRDRKVLQWGGLSDQFDEYERRHGVTLELLRFFRSIDYPICFSTKAVWWTEDARYAELFRDNPHWNVKVSIITEDADKAAALERGCPSPQARLAALGRIAGWHGGGATLRLRPFVIGVSNPSHVSLIRHAADEGAGAVTTEFLCVEGRVHAGHLARYHTMNGICGYDVLEKYRQFSRGSGYLRLNRKVKEPFVEEMRAACAEHNLRFYVSDAHFKECCANGCCCGLPTEWNYSRGQFTQALWLARQTGTVSWSDIAPSASYLQQVPWRSAEGFNTKDIAFAAQYRDWTLFDWMHYHWNTPASARSPYKYFGGVLVPDGVDDQGDMRYRYVDAPAHSCAQRGGV